MFSLTSRLNLKSLFHSYFTIYGVYSTLITQNNITPFVIEDVMETDEMGYVAHK